MNSDRSANKKIRKAAILLLLVSAVLAQALLCSCGTGTEIASVTKDGVTYAARGSTDGIKSVTVVKDGAEVAVLTARQNMSDPPYSDGDGFNYGLTVDDIDLDGNCDVVIQTSRIPGAERYVFYMGGGSLSFTADARLSALVAPSFGRGDGKICSTSHDIFFESRNIPGTPDEYTERLVRSEWGRDPVRGIVCLAETALTFYSEQNIYCLSVAKISPDTDSSELETESEKWIKPDELPAYGFQPFAFPAG
ncbi:MAG: hypothetical protein IJU46_07045 [Clostridia bacterium]|nr:hypothetical protein [Clostridia bacterium]